MASLLEIARSRFPQNPLLFGVISDRIDILPHSDRRWTERVADPHHLRRSRSASPPSHPRRRSHHTVPAEEPPARKYGSFQHIASFQQPLFDHFAWPTSESNTSRHTSTIASSFSVFRYRSFLAAPAFTVIQHIHIAARHQEVHTDRSPAFPSPVNFLRSRSEVPGPDLRRERVSHAARCSTSVDRASARPRAAGEHADRNDKRHESSRVPDSAEETTRPILQHVNRIVSNSASTGSTRPPEHLRLRPTSKKAQTSTAPAREKHTHNRKRQAHHERHVLPPERDAEHD